MRTSTGGRGSSTMTVKPKKMTKAQPKSKSAASKTVAASKHAKPTSDSGTKKDTGQLTIKQRKEIQNNDYEQVAPPSTGDCASFEPHADLRDIHRDNVQEKHEEEHQDTYNDLIAVQNSTRIVIAQWNVNGLNSITKKKDTCDCSPSPLVCYLDNEDPDVMFLFEIKLQEANKHLYDNIHEKYTFHPYMSSNKGYAGVGLLVRSDSVMHQYVTETSLAFGIDHSTEPAEARVMTLRTPLINIVGCYVMNSKRGLERVEQRLEYDETLKNFVSGVINEQSETPILWLGDFNCAPQPIDVWDSIGNSKNAGHSVQERESFRKTLNQLDLVDVYRHHNPRRQKFSFWPALGGKAGLEKNRGWRLDHFIMKRKDLKKVEGVEIRDTVRGSDHCPLSICLSL